MPPKFQVYPERAAGPSDRAKSCLRQDTNDRFPEFFAARLTVAYWLGADPRWLPPNPCRARDEVSAISERSIRWSDDGELRPLRGIPRASALLVHHAAGAFPHAAGRGPAHDRADNGRRCRDRRRSGHRMVVVVPTVVAAVVVAADVDVALDVDVVDVVDAGAAGIVRARIGTGVVHLGVLPRATATGLRPTATTAAARATAAAAPTATATDTTSAPASAATTPARPPAAST